MTTGKLNENYISEPTHAAVIVENNDGGGIALSNVEAPIAEARVANGTAIEVNISRDVYMAIQAVLTAFNNNDEDTMSLYVALAENRVREVECATKGYRHFSLEA